MKRKPSYSNYISIHICAFYNQTFLDVDFGRIHFNPIKDSYSTTNVQNVQKSDLVLSFKI